MIKFLSFFNNINFSSFDQYFCCFWSEALNVCNGDCPADVDEDGVCDNAEIFGCTDENACNYNSIATEEDSSCAYLDVLDECGGSCTADLDNDGVITTEELAAVDQHNKVETQTRIAVASFIVMTAMAALLVSGLIPDSRISALGPLISTLFIAKAGIVYTTRGHQQPECFCTMIAGGFQADFQPDRARFLDERDDHDDPSLHAKTRVEWMTDTRRAAPFYRTCLLYGLQECFCTYVQCHLKC